MGRAWNPSEVGFELFKPTRSTEIRLALHPIPVRLKTHGTRLMCCSLGGQKWTFSAALLDASLSARRAAGNSRLGVEKLSSSQINKMNWEVLELPIFLSSHLPAFCTSVNLLCFSDLSSSRSDTTRS
jgi:hypothetical protein